MISFASDYLEGAHPLILQKLLEANPEQFPGYGEDRICAAARDRLREAAELPDAEIYFLSGGTQANRVVISALLRPYEGVIAAESGHIAAHEAGAIEAGGHKVLTLPSHAGKLDAQELRDLLRRFYRDANHAHMVFPGMVYLSWPTEYGTLYGKEELRQLYILCREYGIPLFIDGARLGYGLGSPAAELTLPELAQSCDVLSVGGTKMGALLGEALLFTNRRAPVQFPTQMKQQGALLAKGWAIGIQFNVLFSDRLYWRLGRHGVEMAERMKEIFRAKGYTFYLESPTNQQFLLLDEETLARLRPKVGFSLWEAADETHSIVRFATSWATKEQSLEKLREIL